MPSAAVLGKGKRGMEKFFHPLPRALRLSSPLWVKRHNLERALTHL